MRGKYFVVGAVAAASLLFFSTAQAAEWTVGGGEKSCKTLKKCVNSKLVQPGDTIFVPAGLQKGMISVKKQKLTVIGASTGTGTTLQGGFKLSAKSNGFTVSDIDFNSKAPISAKGADNVTILSSNFRNANTAILMDGCKFWTIGRDATTGNTFTANVNFAVYGKGSDNITVANNTIDHPIQGITNWEGSNWQVTDNVIQNGVHFNGGGGIGILIASTSKVTQNNVVSGNKVSGAFTYDKTKDLGDNAGAGIALVANGANKKASPSVTGCLVQENSVAITSQAVGTLTTAYGIMLNEILPKKETSAPKGWVKGNTIAGNILTGSTAPYGERPTGIDQNNVVTTDAGTFAVTEEAVGSLIPY